MAQSNLCLVLLFSAFTTASAPQPLTSDLECSEVDRLSMLDECKISRCRVKELCHDKRLGIWSYRHRNFITCESLECLNGGTPILPYQRGNRKTRMLHTDCEVEPPFCQCPTGFSGRCCENGDTDICANVYCPPGTVCIIDCTGSPCIAGARCVPTDKPGTCPADYKLARRPCRHECEKDWDCEGTKKCCGRFCSRVCLEPEDLCGGIVCPKGTVCDGLPPKPKCLPININKPGTCPRDRYVRELTRVTDFCSHECSGDVDCPEYKKCCVRFCSRVCVDPELPGTCPWFRDIPGSCVIRCVHDHQCPAGHKCCRNGCGRECVDREATGSGDDPCSDIACPASHRCVVRKGYGMCVLRNTKGGVIP